MIGIPSVYRQENYLETTLDSILKYPSREDQESVIVILLLCDDSEELKRKRASEISHSYTSAIANGSLLIVNQIPGLSKFLNPDNLAKNFHDSESRIVWRSRQNIDIAMTMWFALQVSSIEHYMLLEDDVILHKDYLKEIKSYMTSQLKIIKVS